MKRFLRFLAALVFSIVLLFVGIAFYLQTQNGQTWLSKKVINFASEYLKTEISGQISYQIPNWVVIENYQLKTPTGDTLLSGKRLEVALSMWALRHDSVLVSNLHLENTTAYIHRQQASENFNYQFLIDAFSSGSPTETTAKPMAFQLASISAKNFTVRYNDFHEKTFASFHGKEIKTGFEKLDFDKEIYHLKDMFLDGVLLSANQTTPQKKQSVSPPLATILPDVRFQKIEVKNSSITFQENKQKGSFFIEKLGVDAQLFSLKDKKYNFGKIDLKAQTLTYDNDAIPKTKSGFDASHLQLKNIYTSIQSIDNEKDNYFVDLKNLAFKEKSGVEIQQFFGKITYQPNGFSIEKFLLKTPKSQLSNHLSVTFPSPFKTANAVVDIRLKNSFLAVQELTNWLPELVKNEYIKKIKNEKITFEGNLKGKVNDLRFDALQVNALNSHLAISGQIKGLPNLEKTQFNLAIKEAVTTQKTLALFLDKSFFTTYSIPQKMRLTGKINGFLNNIQANLALNSDLGDVRLEGIFKDFFTKNATPNYNGFIEVLDFNAQKFLKNDDLRTISASTRFSGKGISSATAVVSFDGQIEQAFFQKYNYQNLVFKGNYGNDSVVFDVLSADKNFEGNLTGTIRDLTKKPKIEANGNFDNLDLQALGFSETPLRVKGGVEIQFADIDAQHPIGTIVLTSAAYKETAEWLEIGALTMKISEENSFKKATISASFLDAEATGNFEYAQLTDVLLTEINRYFNVPQLQFRVTVQPYYFSVKGTIKYNELFRSFQPNLTAFEPITLNATFTNQQPQRIEASFLMPYVRYDSMDVRNVVFQLNADSAVATYFASLASVQDESFRVKKARLEGTVSNDVASFQFTVKDSVENVVHGVAGNLKSLGGRVRIAMNETGNLLYYKPWKANGALDIYKEGVVFEGVNFSSENQLLSINSIFQEPNSPIRFQAQNIDIKELTTAFLQDSTLVSGAIDADVEIRDIDTSPTYLGNFNIHQFTLTNIPLGELSVNASSKGKDKVAILSTLVSAENDIQLSGDYQLSGENPLDLVVDLKKLGAKTVEAFSFGEIKEAEGNLFGELKVTGSLEKPILKGDILFNDVAFRVKQLGTKLKANDQRMRFKGSYFELDKFELTDEASQKMYVSGRMLYGNPSAISYRFKMIANDFLAVNAQRNDNEYFYGKGIVNADINFSGVNERYSVDGDLAIQKGSNLFMLLPDDVGEANEMEQMITFVDTRISTKKESKKENDHLGIESEIQVKITSDENAELTIVVDELNGDYLRLRGNANLSAGIDKNGELFTIGTYDITDGTYELTYQLLKKEFTVLKGSKITWTGDPLNGIMDITAVYKAKAPLYDFLSGENIDAAKLEPTKTPIPLEIRLLLKGQIMEFSPVFQIAISKEMNEQFTDLNLEDKGLSVINEFGKTPDLKEQFTNKINKQSFSLLMLGRFFPDNTQAIFGSYNAEAMARQSVSKLLSEQLDRFASQLIKGVDLDIGVASEYAVENGNRSTEVNLGLKKTFLNDRISVSVGRNFELENTQKQSSEIFDNLTANYNITKDGRYRFKAYRKNSYQTVLEGFVVETGIGFVITLDYDTLKEAFHK